jgi:hypothetical protein
MKLSKRFCEVSGGIGPLQTRAGRAKKTAPTLRICDPFLTCAPSIRDVGPSVVRRVVEQFALHKISPPQSPLPSLRWYGIFGPRDNAIEREFYDKVLPRISELMQRDHLLWNLIEKRNASARRHLGRHPSAAAQLSVREPMDRQL